MALSDHDHTVLGEMEAALRTATARLPAGRVPRRYLPAAIGLALAGALATILGVRLADSVGTVLGVLGFLLIVGSGWSASHLLAPLWDWTRNRNAKAPTPPR